MGALGGKLGAVINESPARAARVGVDFVAYAGRMY
jgi:hypothetical protein